MTQLDLFGGSANATEPAPSESVAMLDTDGCERLRVLFAWLLDSGFQWRALWMAGSPRQSYEAADKQRDAIERGPKVVPHE